MNNLTLSIKQLNGYIKNIFDNEELLIGISVYGEVTNFKISNGIAYFDIKEEGAQLSCIKFSANYPFAKNGDQVLVTGRLNYHIRLGKLSFVCDKVEQYGMGELYKNYLELKARLEAEGLFDASHKKEIKKYNNKIGVVTSETGAVIRDIYHVTRKKNPHTDILVYPSRVQGTLAELEIAEGIRYLDENSDVDVIIVARGGGSFEDLAPFNTEEVARAIFGAKKPVISAVGHETDFSISDFAADFRAPTPSVAAEVAVFDFFEELAYLGNLVSALKSAQDRKIKNRKLELELLLSSVGNISVTSCVKKKSEIYEKAKKIENIVDDVLVRKKSALDLLVAKLEKSNPLAVLFSGYAKLEKGRTPLSSVRDLAISDEVTAYLKDGRATLKVIDIKESKDDIRRGN